MESSSRTRINPKKLLLSKWTATKPQNKEKHFIVSKVILPENPELPIELVELEAVYSKRIQTLAWRALTDTAEWRQGWH